MACCAGGEPSSTCEQGVPPRRTMLTFLVAITFALWPYFCVLLFHFCPLLPFEEVAWPLPSLTFQLRGSKIKFINSTNSINKQN